MRGALEQGRTVGRMSMAQKKLKLPSNPSQAQKATEIHSDLDVHKLGLGDHILLSFVILLLKPWTPLPFSPTGTSVLCSQTQYLCPSYVEFVIRDMCSFWSV